MPTITHHGTCPTCGQSLINEQMRRAVDRALDSTERALRAKLLPDVEAKLSEELEVKYADDNARAWARAQELQHQLDRRSAHDRGVGREHDVLAVLKTAFPIDKIERDGRRGDILHTVVHGGHEVGLILYECKNAATFQSKWIAKLKDDGRKRRTPYLILVSSRLPVKEAGICVRDDIAICEPRHAASVAAIVRPWVIATHRADAISQDATEKARRVYDYLASDEFRGDFDGIMACSRELDEQIAAERSYHDRMWAGRDRVQERLRTASLMINANLASQMEDASASAEVGDLVLETPSVNGAAHA
jgi:hypothetical protein